MARSICEQCGLQYRDPEDFAEHSRVGCRMTAGTGPTWSEKDREPHAADGTTASATDGVPADAVAGDADVQGDGE